MVVLEGFSPSLLLWWLERGWTLLGKGVLCLTM